MKAGDRVTLKDTGNWTQPYNRWAQRKRAGTVESVFIPIGGSREVCRVRFDRSPATTRPECFDVSDITLTPETK